MTAAESDLDVVDESPPNPTIEFRDIDSLVPYARNARKHSEEQVAQIAALIDEYGWTAPVLTDDDVGIVAGHGRLLAANVLYGAGKTLRMADGSLIPLGTVPTLSARGWTESQKRAYVLADNRVPMNAAWDYDLLKAELGDIKDLGVDIATIGFPMDELDVIFNGWNSDIDLSRGKTEDLGGIAVTIKVQVERVAEQVARDVMRAALDAAGITHDL